MSEAGILQNIGKHILLDRAESDYFISLISERRISKKEIVQREGEPCDHIYFVQEGVLRAYYRDRDDNESIIMFAVKDWWVTDMNSFAHGEPALLYIDALEESLVFQLHRNAQNELFEKMPKFERFFRLLMQNAYIREQFRVVQNLSMPAQDRYENFLKKYPQFAQRVPLKQIASYLGITPEFLSVLRRKKAV